jgi:DNA-binding transcriptional LysR family regulator
MPPTPKPTLSVTASETISAHLLGPIVARLRAEQPGIELEIVASNQARDLHRREADIAIRNFRSSQPDLYAKKLKDSAAWLYATPAYLESLGPLCSAGDLGKAEFFAFDRTSTLIDGMRAIGIELHREQFPIVTDNHLVQWQLCKQGLGICIMMQEVGDAETSVVRVFPEMSPLPVPIWLVCHRELHTSRRIRLVFDLIAEELAG